MCLVWDGYMCAAKCLMRTEQCVYVCVFVSVFVCGLNSVCLCVVLIVCANSEF